MVKQVKYNLDGVTKTEIFGGDKISILGKIAQINCPELSITDFECKEIPPAEFTSKLTIECKGEERYSLISASDSNSVILSIGGVEAAVITQHECGYKYFFFCLEQSKVYMAENLELVSHGITEQLGGLYHLGDYLRKMFYGLMIKCNERRN